MKLTNTSAALKTIQFKMPGSRRGEFERVKLDVAPGAEVELSEQHLDFLLLDREDSELPDGFSGTVRATRAMIREDFRPVQAAPTPVSSVFARVKAAVTGKPAAPKVDGAKPKDDGAGK